MDGMDCVSQLLVAAPWLRDPNFARTVVLVCLQSEEGSLGLVLNRPLEMTLGEGLSGAVAPARAAVPIFGGGPVAATSVFALHNVRALGEGSRDVLDGIRFMPGSPSLLAVLEKPPRKGEVLRVYAGCAGWSPGQLESEVSDDAWIVIPACSELIFTGDPGTLWRRALRTIGPEGAFLATMPDDLRLN